MEDNDQRLPSGQAPKAGKGDETRDNGPGIFSKAKPPPAPLARPSRSILKPGLTQGQASVSSVPIPRKRKVQIAPQKKGTKNKKGRPKYGFVIPRALREKLIASRYFEDDYSLDIKTTKRGPALNAKAAGSRLQKKEGALARFKYVYAGWEAQHMKTGNLFDYDLYIRVALVIQLFVILFLIWDVIATVYFEIPHLTWMRHNGVIWPLHITVAPLCLHGFMLCCAHYRKGSLKFWAVFNLCLVIPIFLLRGYVDYYFFNDRYEGGSNFEVYEPGPDNRPFDYDPEFQYEALRIAKFWELEYETEDHPVADILKEFQDKEEASVTKEPHDVHQ